MSASVAQLRPDIDPLASLDPVLLRALTTHAHAVVSIVDRGGRVLFSGGALERVFGYAPEERYGRPVLDVVHPDDVEYARSRLQELLSDDEALASDPVAVRVRHRSGEYRNCEITGTRLQHAGSTALLVLHTRDVTAQARADARSAAAEVRLEMAIRGADLGFWEFDVDSGRVTRTEEWFERHRLPPMLEDRPSAEWRERIHPEDLAEFDRATVERLTGRSPGGHLEYRLRNVDGQWTWVGEYAAVISRHADGSARLMTGVCYCPDETKALQRELEIANERLQLAVDASGLALWDWWVDEAITHRTSSWDAMMRAPERSPAFWQLHGSPGLETVHPDDQDHVRAAFRAHARGETPSFAYEVRRLCGDGSVRWMRTTGMAVERGPNGWPRRVVGCTTDVHERRLAEERLAESERRFRTASNLASEYIAELAVAPDGSLRLVWCSEQMPALLACDRERFMADCGSGRFVHPEELAAFRVVHADVLAGRTREWDTRLVALDGRIVPVRMAVQPTAFGADGRVTRLLSTVLVKGGADDLLLEGGVARLQQTMLEYIPACVVLLGTERRIRAANPLLRGHFPEATIGGELEDCFHPQWRPVVAAALDRCRDEDRNVEVEGLAPAATRLAGHSYRMHVAPVRTRDGFGGWCVVVRDVTHSRDAEAHAFTAMGRDTQRVGHELHDGVGQQLTGAVLMIQTLATELISERHRLSGDVERIAGLVNHSIDDVRMLARSLSPVGTAPTGLAVAMHSLAARARSLGNLVVDLHLSVQPGHALSAVECDHLYWIAQEAVSNAIRHAAARRLEISLEVSGERFALQVRDDGRGAGAIDAAGSPLASGLRLMAHRARGLGANFTVTPRPDGGTLVTCVRAGRD